MLLSYLDYLTNTATQEVQVHLKKFEYLEKLQLFSSVNSESETLILHKFITHRGKYLKLGLHVLCSN